MLKALVGCPFIYTNKYTCNWYNIHAPFSCSIVFICDPNANRFRWWNFITCLWPEKKFYRREFHEWLTKFVAFGTLGGKSEWYRELHKYFIIQLNAKCLKKERFSFLLSHFAMPMRAERSFDLANEPLVALHINQTGKFSPNTNKNGQTNRD